MKIEDMMEEIKKDFYIESISKTVHDQTSYFNFSNLFYLTYYRQNPRYINIYDIHFISYGRIFVGKSDLFYKKIKNILQNTDFIKQHMRNIKIQKIKEKL
jgi:hypothetical protein